MSEGKKEILLGDCLELMKNIPNGSIDMILADLPYQTTNLGWDISIDMEALWSEYYRTAKENAVIVLFGSQPYTSKLILSNIEDFKYEWIWHKNKVTNVLNAKKQPLKAHENILVFYRKQPTYNPIKEKRSENSHTKGEQIFEGKGIYEGKNKIMISPKVEKDSLSYPKSVKYFKSVHSIGKNKTLHPTQKPTELFEYLIKTYTNEGDLVLDNTAGSGTTAIACLNTNRQFIVMEKEKKYYDIILKRVGDFNKKFETQTLFGNEM